MPGAGPDRTVYRDRVRRYRARCRGPCPDGADRRHQRGQRQGHASAIAIGIAAAGGAIGMGMAISKSAEGIARQPEAEGKIRTTMMLGLVFLETAIIYALLVVILIIFVL